MRKSLVPFLTRRRLGVLFSLVVFGWLLLGWRSDRRPIDAATCSVCLPISITTRQTPWRSLNDTSFVKGFIPSFLHHLEPQCRYALYLGYDINDPLLDQPGSEDSLLQAIGSRLPPNVELKTFRYDAINRNVWAVNYATEECFNDGYEYFFRVNDDSELVSATWTSSLVRIMTYELKNWGVVGVVDPGMKRIFTHSLVHRRHFRIFRFHFPFLFANWWSDDWITWVYGSELTYWSSVRVLHRRMTRRYSVDSSIESKLENELQETRLEWRTWKKEHPDGDEERIHESLNLTRPLCPWDELRGSDRDAAVACIRRAHHCVEVANPDLLDPCAHLSKYSFERLWRLESASLIRELGQEDWPAIAFADSITLLNRTLLLFREKRGWNALASDVTPDALLKLAREEISSLSRSKGALVSSITLRRHYLEARRRFYSI